VKPVVVGIAGGSASGKSTLTAALAEALRQANGYHVVVLATDRYVDADLARGPTFFSPSANSEMFNWNHPETVNWTRFFGELDALLAQPEAPDVIVIEGLMVLQNEKLRPYLDLRLFIELEADLRALRRLLRNMQRAGMNNDPVFIANYYRECARVGHERYIEPSRVHADLIVRGDAPWERVGPLLLAVVSERIAR
jgi:uridine kinase